MRTGPRPPNMGYRRACCVILGLLAFLGASPGRQARIQKEVTVTLVEVPVRVLRKGLPMKDLDREDFRIYENGVEKEISRFLIVSRRIEDAPPPGPAGEHPRFFLLIFNIYDYGPAVGDAIDMFFRDVFRSGDSVLIMTENRLLNYEHGQSLEDLIAGLKDVLRRFKGLSTQATNKNFQELDHESDRLLGSLRGTGGMMAMPLDQAIIQFFDRYRYAWETYRHQFLLPDADLYETVLRRAGTHEGEKWAFCFQQRDMFPMIKRASQLDLAIENWAGAQVEPPDQVKARLVQAKRDDLRRSFDLRSSLSPDAFSDLFLAADMPFHVVILKSHQTVFSENFELREVGQDYEAMLKRISVSTGGSHDFSNRPTEVLKDAIQKEDYHYLLVYSAGDLPADAPRTIEVRVERKGVDVIYLKRPMDRGRDVISISGVKSEGRGLAFSIAHYRMLEIEGRMRGSARIKLVLYNASKEKVFDEERTVEMDEESILISLNLELLEPGDHFVIIEAADLITGEKDVYSGTVTLASARR